MRKRILVKTKHGIKSYPVKKIIYYNEGFSVEYKPSMFKKDYAYGDEGYNPAIVNDCLYFGKEEGNNSMTPVVMMGDSYDKNCPGGDLSTLIRIDAIRRAIDSYYGKKNSWMWYIVVAIVVLIVAVGGYMYWQNTQKEGIPVQKPQVQQNDKSDVIIVDENYDYTDDLKGE